MKEVIVVQSLRKGAVSVRAGAPSHPRDLVFPHLYHELLEPDDLEGLQLYEIEQNFTFGWSSVQMVSVGAVNHHPRKITTL